MRDNYMYDRYDPIMCYYNPIQLYLSDIYKSDNDQYCEIICKINGTAQLSQIIVTFDSFEHKEIKISDTGLVTITTRPEHARDFIKSILDAPNIIHKNYLESLLIKLYRLFPDL